MIGAHVEATRRVARIDITGRSSEMYKVQDALGRAVERVLPGAFGFVRVDLARKQLTLPPPHEVYFDGRTLRAEESPILEKALRIGLKSCRKCTVLHRVEAMVRFAWDQFTVEHHAALDAAYASLPGWTGATGLPRWLSLDESAAHLWASVEPPGLHIGGLTRGGWWETWLVALRKATRDLPTR